MEVACFAEIPSPGKRTARRDGPILRDPCYTNAPIKAIQEIQGDVAFGIQTPARKSFVPEVTVVNDGLNRITEEEESCTRY